MEVLLIKYNVSYLTVCTQMICSVLSKWHFHFYFSTQIDFRIFSCLGYLDPEKYIKGVKNTFLNLVGYMMHRVLSKFLLIFQGKNNGPVVHL